MTTFAKELNVKEINLCSDEMDECWAEDAGETNNDICYGWLSAHTYKTLLRVSVLIGLQLSPHGSSQSSLDIMSQSKDRKTIKRTALQHSLFSLLQVITCYL